MTGIFEEFQLFRRILCVCPSCRNIVRVSDLRLKVKGSAISTWLDDYEAKELKLAEKEESFNEEKDDLRESSREKGRDAAEKVFNNAICASLRSLQLDPYDVKPILHPIDFVVFKGMNKEKAISDIILLTREHDYPAIAPLTEQIETVVLDKQYDWQVARIDETGNISFE